MNVHFVLYSIHLSYISIKMVLWYRASVDAEVVKTSCLLQRLLTASCKSLSLACCVVSSCGVHEKFVDRVSGVPFPVPMCINLTLLASYYAARIMDPKEKPNVSSSPPTPRLDCIKCFDMLWFCYSPFHQMQNYYRYGEFDTCFGKWGDLMGCLALKTKRKAEVEEILIAREKAKPHIWTYRTVDEASENWWRMYKHAVMMSPLPGSAQLPPRSDESW